jgi:hypothetical protein
MTEEQVIDIARLTLSRGLFPAFESNMLAQDKSSCAIRRAIEWIESRSIELIEEQL